MGEHLTESPVRLTARVDGTQQLNTRERIVARNV